jgi:uncharacterized protein (DUF1778 family)
MASATAERKSGRLVARVTPEDKALLKRAALLEGRSLGRFVVSHSRAAAEKVLRDGATIRLNAQESRRFVQALLAPPRPATRRFKEALALYRKTVIER